MSTLEALGGEDGCMRLSHAFYRRVAGEPELARLFPGKSVRCATEEFAAFLVQFLGGDDARTQKRWWLSLRESHARFTIGPSERAAWLRLMFAALEEVVSADSTRSDLFQFFAESSLGVIGLSGAEVSCPELRERWAGQLQLDSAIEAILRGSCEDAIRLSDLFASRPSVYVGLLMRMLRVESLVGNVLRVVEGDPCLLGCRFNGRVLLHSAAGAGRLSVVEALLRLGADSGVVDAGGHTPLYSVANEDSGLEGASVVRALVAAGADVNEAGGVTRATPLHMAARRGNVAVAETLLESGADPTLLDAKGCTAWQRAINCRQTRVARLLESYREPN
jgi:hemoglobin